MATHLLSFIYSELALNSEIIRYLSPVRVYFPWGIQPPAYTDDSGIIMTYPPEDLRPIVDMNLMLGECYNWAYERGDKSRNEIVKTGSGTVPEESINNIRAILSGKPLSGPSEKEMSTRWHLLLHLSDRFEVQRREADRMIEAIRKRRSPLYTHADLTDKELCPLETLQGMDGESLVSSNNMRQLLKAWHCLFGGYTEDGDLLLILDRPVFEYLLNEYERLFSENNLKTPLVFSFKAPIFQEGKNDDTRDDIQTIFSAIINKERPSMVMDLFKGFEFKHCTGSNDRHILNTVLYIDPNMVKNDPFLRLFSDRIIVHAEINLLHDK